jgi:hypothetical protein
LGGGGGMNGVACVSSLFDSCGIFNFTFPPGNYFFLEEGDSPEIPVIP